MTGRGEGREGQEEENQKGGYGEGGRKGGQEEGEDQRGGCGEGGGSTYLSRAGHKKGGGATDSVR